MLNGKQISDKDYENFLIVWNKFKMKTMKDYHDLYLKCDVLLLVDVSEKLRNNSLKIMSKSIFKCTSLKLGCSG